MKRTIMLLAAGLVALFLYACSTVTTVPASDALANLQKQVVKQCAVVQPFLSSMTAMQSQLSSDAIAQLAQASADVSKVCAFASNTAEGAPVTFSIADVQALANQAIPSLIRIIDLSPLDQAQKTAAEIAITAAQVAIATAIASAQ
ncbi:hypothetical protein [Caballeronia sp. NCTM5]|uniref:hypothetical protein n=1 Tax=Caballeronia sp. NCTM5 TaxID=2921755 RepID=UPI0020297D1C|nr:hypothetical protein [Caballeronia sp. NCTM5]